MDNNFKEVSIMLTKMIEEGNHKLGEYHGWKYEIIRIPTTGHLCGYIFFDRKATEEEFEIMDHNFHGGVTWGFEGKPNQGKYGFDCAHYMDLHPLDVFGGMRFGSDAASYKDMKFVKNNIMQVIDMLENL